MITANDKRLAQLRADWQFWEFGYFFRVNAPPCWWVRVPGEETTSHTADSADALEKWLRGQPSLSETTLGSHLLEEAKS